MTDESKELTKFNDASTALAAFGDEDFGAGFQEMTSQHTIVPILKIVQALSPQLQKSKPQYNKDAKAGMFLISATNQVFDGEDKGALVIPAYFQTKFIEWRPRKDGGGIVNRYKSLAEFERIPGVTKNPEKTGWLTKDGNEIIEYYDFFAFLMGDDGSFSPVLLSFKGSAIRTGKTWNAQLKNQTVSVGGKQRLLPMYSYVWRLVTQEQSNQSGSWFGVTMTRETPVPSLENGNAIIAEARQLVKNIAEGIVRGAEEEEDDTVAGGAGGKSGATGSDVLS